MGAQEDSTRELHHDPVAARPKPPEDPDPPFDPDGSWNRLIGISVDEDTDPIASGTDSWRAILMLWVAADHLPDRERRAAAEQLVDDVFSHPLHPARWRKARSRGVTDDDLRRWAVRYLFEGIWHRERGSANYQDLVYRLKNHLNDRIAAEVLGPDWEREVGKRDGEPPASLDAPISAEDEDDEASRSLLDEVEAREPRFGKPEAQTVLRQLIRRAELTDGERSCLLHRKIQGCDVKETAEWTGYKQGSVRTLTSRAMSKLEEAAAAT